MKVVRVWCEWDVGADKEIYASVEIAKKHLDKAFEAAGFYESDVAGEFYDLASYIQDGYLSFEEVEVVAE